MHPQLDKNRFAPCEKLMDALEECHRRDFLTKALGMCNFEKDELSKCLHSTRVDDSRERIRMSRERLKKDEERRRRAYEETYGKDGYLKQVLEKEK